MIWQYAVYSLRLLTACIMGGIIGHEREQTHRPAGFRTHILVCVGAALVMITSEFIFKRYSGMINIDPTRLGAQVISGIGFLGAGTIIREGINVKGLTTAASLWAVSCVGLAVGAGFFAGAAAATILIYITLISLKRIEEFLTAGNKYRVINVEADNRKGGLPSITEKLEEIGVCIRNIDVRLSKKDDSMMLRLSIKIPSGASVNKVIEEMAAIEGISRVYEEK